MVNKNIQKFAWLLLAILGFGNGITILTVFKLSTWSILAGAGQILGGIILVIVINMAFKKKTNSKSF